MITIDNLLLNSICLFLPVSIYLNYLTYIKNLEIKEKVIILEFSIMASLILMIRYDPSPTIYSLTIYSIPLLIALYKNHLKLYIPLALIIIGFTNASNLLPTLIIIEKLVIYILIHLAFGKTTKKAELYFYFLLEVLILLLAHPKISFENINSIVITSIVFIIYSILLLTTLKKGSKIVDLSKVLKELEHEKLLRSSISKLTHELKNPIAVCQGYLEMMNLKDQEKLKKYLTIITNEIIRSKTIIDEFSSYGKLKKLNIEEMDISFLFEDILELLTPLFKKNKASIKINKTEEIYISGDYNKLKQVFINLLKNTIEASKTEEFLNVEIILKEMSNKVSIKVIDNGVGMSKETLSKVSEVFFTTKSNGTGLGLAYSKEVIELHNGTLKIKSELNKGTKITITLPKEKKSEDFNNKNY